MYVCVYVNSSTNRIIKNFILLSNYTHIVRNLSKV